MIDFSKPQTIIDEFIPKNEFKSDIQYIFNDFIGREYSTKYADKKITYGFYETKFGLILLATTDLGVCYLHFVEDKSKKLKEFQSYFFDCNLEEEINDDHKIIIDLINGKKEIKRVKLHIKGTDFQKAVWKELVKIPRGKLTTYSEVAKGVGNEKASRAVGSAIGMNEIALLIPCHRVIQKTGKLTGFRWGNEKKKQLLIKELG